MKTIQALIDFNNKWVNYLEENKLAILVNSDFQTVQLLSNLRFSNPFVLEFPNGDFGGWEINVQYVGKEQLRYGNEFCISTAYLDYERLWVITTFPSTLDPKKTTYSMKTYFEELDIDKQDEKTIFKVLEDMDLRGFIDEFAVSVVMLVE